MRWQLIVNPVAGRNRAGPLAEAVAGRLRAAGDLVALHLTTGPGEAGAFAAALAPEACERLVVVGGDGTLHEVLNARPLALPWPVGLVPVGTANVVGRELRMPLGPDAEAHAGALRGAEPWLVNLIEIAREDGRRERAVANVGAGLDAAIVHAVASVRRRRTGHGGYRAWLAPIWDTLRRWRFPTLSVTLESGRVFEAGGVVVQGARCYGGLFELAPAAALDAPDLEVSLLLVRTRRDAARLLARAALGRAHHDANLVRVRARALRLDGPPGAVLQADGDPSGTLPVTLRLLAGAATLLRAAPGAARGR